MTRDARFVLASLFMPTKTDASFYGCARDGIRLVDTASRALTDANSAKPFKGIIEMACWQQSAFSQPLAVELRQIGMDAFGGGLRVLESLGWIAY